MLIVFQCQCCFIHVLVHFSVFGSCLHCDFSPSSQHPFVLDADFISWHIVSCAANCIKHSYTAFKIVSVIL